VLGTASLPGKFVRAHMQRVKGFTAKPFGVNLVLPLLARVRSRRASMNASRFWCSFGEIPRRTSMTPIDAA
jgi:hypothetical protein